MINASSILIPLTAVLLLLLLVRAVNKMRPGIIFYRELRLENMKCLNFFHIMATGIMLSAGLLGARAPMFLLFFPATITVSQAVGFLGFFGAIGFFPWERFSEEKITGKEMHISTTGILSYALLRFFFLVVYEWLFRGLLLTGFTDWLGTGWAVVINILLYAAMHFHKTKKEIIGCIPFGLMLCVFTGWWHSLWPAVIFHLQVAIINEGPLLHRSFPPQKRTAI